MKILMVNKFFYIKGGSETYYFALKNMLEEAGHQVIDFSMKDDKNFESPYSDYFVDNVDYSKASSFLSKIKMAMNIVYSFEAKRKFEQLIITEKPDIVHLHIFQHQISPSILDVCKKYNIPTVYTAHDLKMICLNYKMMHHSRICEDCKDGHLYHCVMNKCVKKSFFKSCVNTIEGYLHRWRKSYDVIDCIVTPSSFYRSKFIEFGIDPKRIVHLPNFLDKSKPSVNINPSINQYFLYFGRLSEEKGVFSLVKAMKGIEADLYIVGTGPLKDLLQHYIVDNEINNIKLLGFKEGQELIDIIGNAKAIILPSEWYENGPYSAIEALQLGKPIIGADIGGIPEIVNGNGYLFKSGDIIDLNIKIRNMSSIDLLTYKQMEIRSESIFIEQYTSLIHISKIIEIYNNVCNKGFLL